MMWKHGGNFELLYSRNASLCRVTAFGECSNTAGLIKIILATARCVFVRQTAVCPTKPLAPKGVESLQSRD